MTMISIETILKAYGIVYLRWILYSSMLKKFMPIFIIPNSIQKNV
jgi:hypothetical protein